VKTEEVSRKIIEIRTFFSV